MSSTLKEHRPKDIAWWYRQFIGVRPAVQGTGLGGAAVRAGIQLAREARLPVYVEVMNASNRGYYRYIGYKTITEFDVPDAGPHVWGMLWQA